MKPSNVLDGGNNSKSYLLNYVSYSTDVLADVIPRLPNIESLGLEGSRISPGIMSLIGTHLKHCQETKIVKLARRGICHRKSTVFV